MKTIHILAAMAVAASLIGVSTLVNSSFAASNQPTGPNLAENQAQLNSEENEINEVEDTSEAEDTIDPQFASQAKITTDEARTIAMTHTSTQSSDVQSVTLDDENGQLEYSVEITMAGKSLDVKVDAISGQVTHVDEGLDNELVDGETEDDKETETDGVEHEFEGEEEHED
jgi:uncharacterized membrane protein YkoI